MTGPVEYLWAKYGFRLSGDDYNITVGTGLKTILPNNPRRVAWLLCNVGQYPITISFKQETPYGVGLIVPPGGGVVSMLLDEDGVSVTYPVYAHASDNSTTLWVYEVVQK